VARFLFDLENSLPRLRRELDAGTYHPGPYRCFAVRDPKPRLISAAPFEDRVVHHALTQILEPIFEKRFSPHSFACRKGLGTHRAIDRASMGCRRFPYVLKCDIRKYFASMDHEILKGRLERVIKCRRTLNLAAKIIDGANPQEDVNGYFEGDDLFTSIERRRGVPLGNQTSQFFANVYLDPLDQFVERGLRIGPYVRYVDDFLVFAEDKSRLREAQARIERLLAGLRLKSHPRKSRVYRTRDGVTFLGWRIFPDCRRLVRSNVVRFRKRLRTMQAECASGSVGLEEIEQRIRAWIAHASHGNTWRLRQQVLDEIGFVRRSPT